MLIFVGSFTLVLPGRGLAVEPSWIEEAADCADLRRNFMKYYSSLPSASEADLSDVQRAEFRSVIAAVCGDRFRSCRIDVCPVDLVREPDTTGKNEEHTPAAVEHLEEAYQQRFEEVMRHRRERIEGLMREEREKGKVWQPINPN